MKRVISLLLGIIVLTQVSFAAEFVDMPNNWSTEALQKAVDNKLLGGDGGYIRPDNYMTRAEMATIMVRACGAVNTADISSYSDVKPEDWFYTSMSKAVAMGAFSGADGKLNPNAYITRQEAFVVLARVFSLNLDKNIDLTVIDEFKDGNLVAAWAKEAVAAIVGGGYVAGSDGRINPLNNISRAEFAVVMNRLVAYYIDDASVTTLPSDGNVMIRVGGITIDGAKSDNMVVIGDGAGKTDISFTNGELSNRLVVRGGETVTVEGSYSDIRVVLPYIKLDCGNAEAARIYGCKDSEIYIGTLTASDTTDNGAGNSESETADKDETEKKDAEMKNSDNADTDTKE